MSEPTPELSLIIEKIARAVAKNGDSLELKIKKSKEKFQFLCPENEFYDYYKQKVESYRLESCLEEPPVINFVKKHDASITYKMLDIIKLTAQFIAIYGRPFLIELVDHERDNIDFDFLKPQHGHFKYMTDLVKQYCLVRNYPLDINQELTMDSCNKNHVLKKFHARSAWEQKVANEKLESEREQEIYNQIDWNDFEVVEVVNFDRNEEGDFPEPTTAELVGTCSLQRQRREESQVDMDMEMSSSDGEDQDQSMKIKNYNPKNKTIEDPSWFISPITNEKITKDSINKHIRINLLQPRQAEMKNNVTDEVFASGSEVGDNLRSLAERREDLFCSVDNDNEEKSVEDQRTIWDGHRRRKKPKT